MTIHQAIFTSAKTARGEGYQIVATSPDFDSNCQRELSKWCPSHDALIDSTELASSVNFHPLPDGLFCVSRTVKSGEEYSGRGGRVYTHCLIVTTDVLARFQNNPFSICRAAVASGAMDIQDPLPTELAPLTLPGRAILVDKLVLSDVAAEIGADAFARFVDAAIRESSLAFVVGPVAERLAAALFSCLPPSHRKDLSLTTGLQFSERRPFRWLAVPDDAVQQRQLQRRHGVFIVRATQEENQADAPLSGWARFVGECLSQLKLSVIEDQLRQVGDVESLDELNTLGDECLRKGVIESAEPDGDSISFRSESRNSEPRRDTWRRTQHGAHGSKSVNAPENQPWAARTRPSSQIPCEAPDTRHFLEELDDLIYGGVVGDITSLARLDDLWTVIASDLGEERADQARELYVRLAIDLWNESKDGSVGDPKRAVAAIEVIDQLLVVPELAAQA